MRILLQRQLRRDEPGRRVVLCRAARVARSGALLALFLAKALLCLNMLIVSGLEDCVCVLEPALNNLLL